MGIADEFTPIITLQYIMGTGYFRSLVTLYGCHSVNFVYIFSFWLCPLLNFFMKFKIGIQLCEVTIVRF
jgi:hypothetical protein